MEGGGGVLALVVHPYTRHFLAFGDGLGSCFRHPAPGVVFRGRILLSFSEIFKKHVFIIINAMLINVKNTFIMLLSEFYRFIKMLSMEDRSCFRR